MKKVKLLTMLPGQKTILIPVVLLVAFLVKSYYSNADSDSLFWVLGPTAFLVEFFSGIAFTNESGIGWVNWAYDVVIAPSCGGVNFLIILFCMASFRLVFSKLSMPCLLKAVVLTTFLAYLLTLSVNGLRIWLSIILYHSDIYSGWLSPDSVHRIAGVGVYYLFLCFYYLLVSFILRRVEAEQQVSESVSLTTGQILVPVVPLFWYLLLSLGVPFANNAYGLNPERFMEHAFTVFTTSVLVSVVLLILAVVCRCVFFKRRIIRGKDGKTNNPGCRGRACNSRDHTVCP